jgi:hypothetical protein
MVWAYHPSKERPFLERIRVGVLKFGHEGLAYGSNHRLRTVAVAKRVIKESLQLRD